MFVFSVNYLKSKMNQPLKNQKEWNPKWQRFAQSMLTGEASTTSQKPSNLTLRSIYYLVPLSFLSLFTCVLLLFPHTKKNILKNMFFNQVTLKIRQKTPWQEKRMFNVHKSALFIHLHRYEILYCTITNSLYMVDSSSNFKTFLYHA